MRSKATREEQVETKQWWDEGGGGERGEHAESTALEGKSAAAVRPKEIEAVKVQDKRR